jgi:carotenoid 1,2-hydratase
MTERGRGALAQETRALSIGRSALVWEDGGLTATFDEITAPVPTRLRGRIRLSPTAMTGTSFNLDGEGRHLWRPIAPRADVAVTLTDPALSWRGQGYFDTNAGEEPVHRGFRGWDWARAHRARDSLIHYDVVRASGEAASLALRIDNAGVETMKAAPFHLAPRTGWRLERRVRSDAPPRLRRTLEDAPFYSRSVFDGELGGAPAEIVHESLSTGRLRSPLVQAMLPFRMPRGFG